jgi:hypothetical protein
MQVWIEEEHGYADYIWNAPFDTEEKLFEWWDNFDKEKIPQLVFGRHTYFHPDEKADEVELTTLIERREEHYEKVLGGKIRLVTHSQMTMAEEEWDTAHAELKACNYYLHVHEEDDSFLATVDEPIVG